VKNISNRRSGRKLSFAAVAISVAVGAGLAAGARIAGAANVNGLMTYRDGKPAARRWLHYENRVTSDIYLAPTTPDGLFTADLPPGFYDLRAERGVILASKIRVDTQDLNLGPVVEPAALDVCRLFEHEGVADVILESPAPATAKLIGRPLEAMQYGYESVAMMPEPAGTPAPRSTPLGEATPAAAPSPSTMHAPSGGH
jgi:hypothetical protein